VKSLRAGREELKAKDVQVLGVSKDKPEDQKKFGSDCGADFPLLSDLGGNLHALLGIGAMPDGLPRRVTILVDKNGVVKKIDKQVKVDSHGKDIAEAF
jgi:peroxiredoxin Q/BCP